MKRPYILVIIGVLLIIAAIVLNYTLTGSVDDDADAVSSTPPASSSSQDAANAGQSTAPKGDETQPASQDDKAAGVDDPSFDVVRVSPDGSSVIAGRAEPNSKVRVREGKDVIGEATADDRGEWVILPEKHLEPGDRELSVESESKNGKVHSGNEDVVVLIPKNPTKDTSAPIIAQKDEDGAAKAEEDKQPIIALRVPSDGKGPATVLQGPGAVAENNEITKAANEAARDAGESEIAKTRPRLSVGVVDYDNKGQVSMSGDADPDHKIRVYLDNKFVGDALSNDDGDWAVTLDPDVNPGQYKLRADEVDKQGKVVARIELPFERADAKKAMAPGSRYVVQPGNSLWRIARRAYGDGIQYWVIYHRNEDQIRDPDLIYPGQIFALPEEKKAN